MVQLHCIYNSLCALSELRRSHAFLHGHLQENVYIFQPLGFSHSSFPTHVCKLKNALNGLKQAPRAWLSYFSNTLHELGLSANKYGSSLLVLLISTFLITQARIFRSSVGTFETLISWGYHLFFWRLYLLP
jgi:hypothetical protein